MTAHLIPHYGPHSADQILGGRPLAYPGLYATPPAAAPTPTPSLCDWFDPAAEASWRTVFGSLDWSGPQTGGWFSPEAAATFTSGAAGGWFDPEAEATFTIGAAGGFYTPATGDWKTDSAGGFASPATGDWKTDATGDWKTRKPCG